MLLRILSNIVRSLGNVCEIILYLMRGGFDNNNNNNNGNFICVVECTIVNLATYRQFKNAA